MEEEKQKSDCDVTERSRRSKLPENPGRVKDEQTSGECLTVALILSGDLSFPLLICSEETRWTDSVLLISHVHQIWVRWNVDSPWWLHVCPGTSASTV